MKIIDISKTYKFDHSNISTMNAKFIVYTKYLITLFFEYLSMI